MSTPPRILAAAVPTAVLLSAFSSVAMPPAALAAPPSSRPFADASLFNRPLPPRPAVAPNSRTLHRGDLTVAYSEYSPAVYVGGRRDPVYVIRLTSGWGPNPLDGRRVRIPRRARPAGDDDGHMTVVLPDQRLVISLYQAEPRPRGRVWRAAWGGMASLRGSGANRRDSNGGRESGISQLAGLITPDDVRRGLRRGEKGDLGHALALMHPTVSDRRFVRPANRAGGNSSSASALLMGQRVFLDRSVNVRRLRFEGGAKARRFGRLVARTLQRYGAIVVTNSSSTGFQMVNPISWTSLGRRNPWPALVGPSRAGYYGFAVRGIPVSRLRAVRP